MKRIAATLLMLGAVYTTASARIDLVTLPSRASTELTIYNTVDLTLVRETRPLTFSAGANEVQFSWSETRIDPTSLELDLKDAPGLTLLDARFPVDSPEIIIWTIEAEEDTSAPVEIRYFVSGLGWEARYTLVANESETAFRLQQDLRVSNESGEDFENSRTRVVVGEPLLTADLQTVIINWNAWFESLRNIRGARVKSQVLPVDFDMDGSLDLFFESERAGDPFARADEVASPFGGMAGAGAFNFGLTEAKEILKKGVSEYQLYSVEGEETIPTGWKKQLPSPAVEDVPFDLSYELDARRYGPEPVLMYKLKNDADHELGEQSLPGGSFYVYTRSADGLDFVGTTDHDYVPPGEDIELNLGPDGFLVVEERVMDVRRESFDFLQDNTIAGHDEWTRREFEIRNGRDRDVPFRMVHYIGDSWDLDASSHEVTRVDRETLRWDLTVPAGETLTVNLSYRQHFGSNAK